MKGPPEYEFPEPVPPASQLLALPFVSAVAGYLTSIGCDPVRVTLHRVMTRDTEAYLQQVCSYAGVTLDHTKAGRLFTVAEGVIGRAFTERRIVRTKFYESEEAWLEAYIADRIQVGDCGAQSKTAISFLAVPLLGEKDNTIVCILFVEAGGLNWFVENGNLDAVLGLSEGYCRMLDGLIDAPLPKFRNYPLPPGMPVGGTANYYPRLQEIVSDRAPPRLARLSSFNFAPTP